MKTIKLLHISDLHRGDSKNKEFVGEHKDPAVSKSFAGTITAPMEIDFVEAIKNWQKLHGAIDAIICTGDLGEKGDADKILEGVSFINLLQKELSISSDNVLICPGNHDADRNKTEDDVFSGFSSALTEYGYKDHQYDLTPFSINGIPFIVMNTSLGASEKSLFVLKYKELISVLDAKDQSLFKEEVEKSGMQFLNDCLDIPAVTNKQRQRVLNAITQIDTTFVVLIMHHNLIPCNTVEIRPYSSVIDAGKTLDQLKDTDKDLLILHGHVHFPSSSILRWPRSVSSVSSVGSGLFNETSSSSVNVIELFCSDEGDHLITVVYEYIKQVNGFKFNKSFCIYHSQITEDVSSVLNLFESDPGKGIIFSKIKEQAKCSERDLLRIVLSNDSLFSVSRNKSINVDDWVIHRK